MKDNRTFEEVVKDIDEIMEEMGPLPDNSAENRRRLLKIERYLASIPLR